jgi:glycosyltransferase involved in cell wall biosynthesis
VIAVTVLLSSAVSEAAISSFIRLIKCHHRKNCPEKNDLDSTFFKMKIVYISSSIIPSRTANSIHVMKMCQAFATSGNEVVLLAPHDKKNYEPGVDDVFGYYGVERCFEIVKIPWLSFKGKGYYYGVLAARKAHQVKPDMVFGRNLAGCAFSAFVGLPVMFESHAPIAENGRTAEWLFNKLSRHISLRSFIVITHSLKEHYLSTHPHLAGKIHVAPDGADPVSPNISPVALPNAGKRLQVGYVGNLYKGKGMEVITELARLCDWADFHVVGGAAEDISFWKTANSDRANISFHGFVPYRKAISFQKAFDVLLLPNQESVKAHGSGRVDIASWTSPLKLFEYMAAGKPIICSDLPVFHEILTHEHNALLCAPGEADKWVRALERLRDDQLLREELASQASHEFMKSYTWQARARQLIGSGEEFISKHTRTS